MEDNESNVYHREVDVAGLTLHICNSAPTFTQVLRAVKRQEHGLFNCIASIIHDWQFVRSVKEELPEFPLVTNLRCGAWYSPAPSATAYFKSTDGHSGQWSFSTARLNLHIASLASKCGGVCIVDATRRGKSFPDALTKTIPIWAAVINRSIVALRTQNQNIALDNCSIYSENKVTDNSSFGRRDNVNYISNATDKFSDQTYGCKNELSETLSYESWNCSDATKINLPSWISANERNEIEKRLDQWTHELLEVSGDVHGLIHTLKKPLRCFWVSQNEVFDDGIDEIIEAAKSGSYNTLSYTPVIAISASRMNCRERRRLRVENEIDQPMETLTRNEKPYKTLDIMYDYIPGAGDDEESWSKGLTPRLMWSNYRDLLESGPKDVVKLTKSIISCNMKQLGIQHSLSDRIPAGRLSDAKASQFAHLDMVWPPKYAFGNKLAIVSSESLLKIRDNSGFVWKDADAVLDLSTEEQLQCFQFEERTGLAVYRGAHFETVLLQVTANELNIPVNKLNECDQISRYLHLDALGVRKDKHAILRHLPACVAFVSYHVGHGGRVLFVSNESTLDIALAVILGSLLACFTIIDNQNDDSKTELLWEKPCSFYQDSKSCAICPVQRNFGRKTVKAYFAAIASKYNGMVLGKPIMRQVFNAFLPRSMNSKQEI